jgi:hypothetical protein
MDQQPEREHRSRTRLNGWQRLWIVLSAIYLLLIVGLTIALWPTPETTWHRDEFLTRMPSDLRGQVEAAYSSTFQWEAALKKLPPAPDEGRQGAMRLPPGVSRIQPQKDRSPIPPTSDFVLVSEPVSFPNRAILQVRVAKEGDTGADVRVAAAYWAVVQSATRAARWEMARVMALVFFVPCLTLYALGWAVAWVRRGFSRA